MINLNKHKDMFARSPRNKNSDIDLLSTKVKKHKRIYSPFVRDFFSGKRMFLKEAVEILVEYNVLVGWEDYDNERWHVHYQRVFVNPTRYTSLLLNS